MSSSEQIARLKIEKSTPPAASGKRKKFIIAGVVAVFVITAAVLYLTGILSPDVPAESTAIANIYPSQTFTILNASGYVVAETKASVASKIMSRLVSLNVEEGSRVKKGEVIAVLENDDAIASKAQAEANLRVAGSAFEQASAELNDAESAFRRTRELVGKEFVSRAEFDTAETRLKKARAGVNAAEHGIRAAEAALRYAAVNLEYSYIRAPFDAVVLTKNADVGDIIAPMGASSTAKAAVVTLADMRTLQVQADVSESNLSIVKPGQPCEIHLDALPDKRFRGFVHVIVPTADRSKASVMVKVRFIDKDPRILPEMSAKVAFLERPVGSGEEKPRLVVNPSALVTRDNRQTAFLIDGARVRAVAVMTGGKLGDMVEVTGGLKAGDKVVMKPSSRLRDGSRIRLAEK